MSHFSKSELIRALSDVEYGIIAYRMLEDMCDAHQAFSEVDLLEKQQIIIRLTARGYEVGRWFDEIVLYCIKIACLLQAFQQVEDVDEMDPQIHETLEDLLWSLSPLYRERHQAEVMARLARYS